LLEKNFTRNVALKLNQLTAWSRSCATK